MVHRSPNRSLVDNNIRTRPRRLVFFDRTIVYHRMDGIRSGNQRVHDGQVARRDADVHRVGSRTGRRGAVGVLELQVHERHGL